jgi:hypothetical protein
MPFVFWMLVRALVRLLVLPRAGDGTKDLEILVLRQQLRVLCRQAGRPRFTMLDRVLLAAAQPHPSQGPVSIVPRHAANAASLAP